MPLGHVVRVVIAVTAFMAIATAQESQQWQQLIPQQALDYRPSIALDSAGNVYIAGSKEMTGDPDPADQDWDFWIMRLTNSGTLDTTWGGGDGEVTIDGGGTAPTDDDLCTHLRIDGSGSIYLVGDERDVDTGSTSTIVVVKLNADGTPATAFDSDGVRRLTEVANCFSEKFALGPGATPRIYVSGGVFAMNGPDGLIVCLDSSDGSLETAFNTTGYLSWDHPGLNPSIENFSAIDVDASGNVVVAGWVDPSMGPSNDLAEDNDDIVVQRYSSAGVLDSTFGTSGLFTYDGGLGERPPALRVSGGTILVGGLTDGGGGNFNTLILMLDSTGSLDASFSGDGVAVYDSGNGNDLLLALDVDASGNVYAAGITPSASNATEDMLILKYEADGTLDTDFDGDGIFTADSGFDDVGQGLVVGGSFYIVAAWGNQLLATRFAASPSMPPPPTDDDDDDGRCGLLGVELFVVLAVLVGVRRWRGR